MEKVDLPSSNRVYVCSGKSLRPVGRRLPGVHFLSFCEDNHISVPMIAITASVVLSHQSDPAMSSEHSFFFVRGFPHVTVPQLFPNVNSGIWFIEGFFFFFFFFFLLVHVGGVCRVAVSRSDCLPTKAATSFPA